MPPDAIRKTTCYMCACRCGIDVHMEGTRVRHIEGNRDHPVNRGVLCAKGAAGIMQHLSPARLQGPLRRVGPRGSGEFREIPWSEALGIATNWLEPVREKHPERLAFFTGRDQSQALTGWWAQQFGTPNYAAHGGFCSVNMAAAGIYTMGGAFWEFGAPDWERTELLLLFGVAEDHDSNPLKINLAKLRARGARIVSVNPVRTGYSAIADQWIGITPGTDGLLILSLVHLLLSAGRVDLDYLLRWTNASHLVDRDPASPGYGSVLRDDHGRALAWDPERKRAVPADAPGLRPALSGGFNIGPTYAKPVFQLIAETYLDPALAPEAVAPACGLEPGTIRRLAAELAQVAFERAITLDRPWTDFRGERHATMTGRPVAVHAMRGISAHSNGFQTCRALHLLQLILGTVETPGGFRFEPPYPKPVELHPKPHHKVTPGYPLDGPPLGFPRGPEDLALDADGRPKRIDKAFTWEAPLAVHGMLHTVIANAVAQDPYPIEVLFLYMANMAWNSAMNTAETMEMLSRTDASGEYVIPRIIVADSYSSEIVAFADLVLPDTTYLERHDCISLLDRPISEPDAASDSIRWPVVEPDRPGHEGVRGFQSVLLDLGASPEAARHGRPRWEADVRGLCRLHDPPPAPPRRRPARRLARCRRQRRGPRRAEPGPGLPLHRERRLLHRARPRAEAAFFKPWNVAYQAWAVRMGFYDAPAPYLFDLWSETLARFQAAALGIGPHQPPDHLRDRLARAMAPLPVWYPPDADAGDPEGYPAPRDHPAPGGDVPFLGLAERLAAPDPRLERPLPSRRALEEPRLRGRRLGGGHLAARHDHRPGRPHGRAEPVDGLDLERHRQARRRLVARPRRARGDARFPAQPPDPRPSPGRAPPAERRPGHRPGRMVRPPRPHRAGPGPAPQPARNPASALTGRSGPDRAGRGKGCRVVKARTSYIAISDT